MNTMCAWCALVRRALAALEYVLPRCPLAKYMLWGGDDVLVVPESLRRRVQTYLSDAIHESMFLLGRRERKWRAGGLPDLPGGGEMFAGDVDGFGADGQGRFGAGGQERFEAGGQGIDAEWKREAGGLLVELNGQGDGEGTGEEDAVDPERMDTLSESGFLMPLAVARIFYASSLCIHAHPNSATFFTGYLRKKVGYLQLFLPLKISLSRRFSVFSPPFQDFHFS